MNRGEDEPRAAAPGTVGAERMVLLMQPQTAFSEGHDAVDLARVCAMLWDGRWTIVVATLLLAGPCLAYAFLAPQWYSAEVLLMSAAPKPGSGVGGQLGQLSGIASLASISLGVETKNAEPLAVLRSRDFVRAFITEHNLLPVLFADDWDARSASWKGEDDEDWPDMHDAVKFFDEDILRVQEDKKNGVVRLAIEWTDASQAARWANLLVERVNDRMRQRALRDAEANLAYLQKEMATAQIVALQESIGRLIEGELQSLMLAKGNEEFAFRVIDPAVAPKWRSRPRRLQIVVLSIIAGGLLGCMIVFVRHASMSRRRATASQ